MYLKELEKEQTKPKVSRRKEIIKIRAEINEIEKKKKHLFSCSLTTHKKAPLQLFRVRWPRPSERSVGTFQGRPNSSWRALPGYLLLCFQKLIPPQSWLGEGLCLSLRENVPERQCSGRKDVGLAVWTDLAGVLLCHLGPCDLGQDPDPLWTFVSSPSKWGHSIPFSSCLCQLVAHSRRTWAGFQRVAGGSAFLVR